MASQGETINVRDVNPNRLNQHIGAIIVSLGGFSLGVSLGWNSSAGDTLRNGLNATAGQIGIVGGILNAGACTGVIFLPWLLNHFSRTSCMIITLPIHLIGWAFICLADQKVSFLIIGRILCGIAGGVFCVLAPVYIGEIADKNIRDKLLIYFQLLINLGIFYAFTVAQLINQDQTILHYSLICSLASLPIVLIKFLPKSPLYYLINDNESDAGKSLFWYRGQNYKYHDDEMRQLKELAKTEPLNFQALKNPRLLCTFIICNGVMVIQQFSGINTVIFYAAVIFNAGGSGNLTSNELILIVGGVQIIFCALCMMLIEHLGRRFLLSLSSGIMGLAMILLGWYTSARDSNPELYEDTYGWMPPTWISLYFAGFNLGLGPISWSILGDILPHNIKILGATYLTFISWLLSLIATLTFGKMIMSLGGSMTILIFGIFSLFASLFFALFTRNTRGMSLADIQKKFT